MYHLGKKKTIEIGSETTKMNEHDIKSQCVILFLVLLYCFLYSYR